MPGAFSWAVEIDILDDWSPELLMSGKMLQICSPMLPAAEGLQVYLQKINAIPLLSAEEEKTYAQRYQTNGDLEAAQQLVLAHLRYVVRIARTYGGYGLCITDLIQEGAIGLMKAVKRFDPAMGVRLVSFAVHWIKSEIHEFVIRNWRIVKVATTKAQRKLFFNLRQSKKRLGWFSKEDIEVLAHDLGVTTKEVREMEMRMNARDDYFDQMVEGESASASMLPSVRALPAPKMHEPAHRVMEENWEQTTHHNLQEALSHLDPRSLDIVTQRYMNEPKASLKTLGEKYALSIERVRQIEKAAIQSLRGHLDQSAF